MPKNKLSKTSLEKRLSELLKLRETIIQEKKLVNRQISEIKKLIAECEKIERLKSLSDALEKVR